MILESWNAYWDLLGHIMLTCHLVIIILIIVAAVVGWWFTAGPGKKPAPAQ